MNATVERVVVRVLQQPLEPPESDGTASWPATTMVLVECSAAGITGIGYTYSHAATAQIVQSVLTPCVEKQSALARLAAHARMCTAVRNQGRDGLAAAAISAMDNALWDLEARLLGVSLSQLLGGARDRVPVYASGGFTSESLDALAREFADYRARGFQRAKLKVGRDPQQDRARVRAAREALGADRTLMVDANGAYERKQALAMAEVFAEYGVEWFEEPVSSDDLSGLRLLRDRAPAGMSIAAGEYGYDDTYFRRMLSAEAVDTLQADATRCTGITGFLRADALASAYGVGLSSHCAPTLHAHAAGGSSRFVHLEYFRDHANMEARLFEGMPQLVDGVLQIDHQRPGLGITLRKDALSAMSSR